MDSVYRFQEQFAKYLGAALVLMYAVVPWSLNWIGLYEIPWGESNLIFSLALAFMVLTLPVKGKAFSNAGEKEHSVFTGSMALTVFLFVICCGVFFVFPWSEDRESLGASVAAACRALWLICTFKYVLASESKKLLVILMTVALVFIDQSRTYFFISFVVLALSSARIRVYLMIGLLATIVVAAIRVDEAISGFGLLVYGVVGEGYNGAKAVGQVMDVSSFDINRFGHLFHTLLQPLLFPLEFFANRVLGFNYPTQAGYLSDLVTSELGQVLSPMGGWYILADFVYYGAPGLICLYVYIRIAWGVARKLLDSGDFPFGAYVFFFALKATPYVYYKFVFYIFIISFFINNISAFWNFLRISLAHERNPVGPSM